MKKTKLYILFSILICLFVILMGIGVGSVYVPPRDTISIVMNKL